MWKKKKKTHLVVKIIAYCGFWKSAEASEFRIVNAPPYR